MNAVVVYESMFGSTRRLAEAIARGIEPALEVTVLRVDSAGSRELAEADLLVAGAPTHHEGLSTPESRRKAAEWARDPARNVFPLEPAAGAGMREWLGALSAAPSASAAFDTRWEIPRPVAGTVSRTIEDSLQRLGSRPLVPPESFLVAELSGLRGDEAEHGMAWGLRIARALLATGSVR